MGDPLDDLPAAQRAAFEQLRRRFCAGLPQRWAQIANAADATGQVAALHRLAGAAGSYGLPELDARARHALRLVESGAQAAQITAALSALQATLEQAADTI